MENNDCPKCEGAIFQSTYTANGHLIHGGLECEDCGWAEADGQPCDKCGVYVPAGEYHGADKPNGGDASRHQPDGCHAFPPGPDDTDGWRRWTRAGGPQPGVRGGSHGAPDRVDRIRLLGNGVVPAQAALAFRELSARVLA